MSSPNSRQVGGKHYDLKEFQHWDWVEWNGLGYIEGQITKYIYRWKVKGGINDLEKALHYTQKLASLHTHYNRRNRRLNQRDNKLELLIPKPCMESVICYTVLIWKDKVDLAILENLINMLIEKAKEDMNGTRTDLSRLEGTGVSDS